MNIEPCMGVVEGGSLVTLHGYHLSLLSLNDSIRITFGGSDCRNISLLASTDGTSVTCITPPHRVWEQQAPHDQQRDQLQGAGLVDVTVAFADKFGDSAVLSVGESLRQATLANGFRYWVLLMATTGHETSRGLLSALSPDTHASAVVNSTVGPGHGPRLRRRYFPAANATTVWETGLQTSAGISAVAVWRDRIVIAGTFARVQAPPHRDVDLADKTHHIAVFDGRAPSALGLGLDGPVQTLASFSDRLIVGGSFARAFQAAGSPLHLKGMMTLGTCGDAWPAQSRLPYVLTPDPHILCYAGSMCVER